MKIHLQVWRQKSAESSGFFETHTVDNITEDMSFFEMLDMLNNDLIKDKKSPIAFDHDCREGICGTCGLVINGRPHGPLKGVTSCQLHMRSFKDGDTLTLEPFRASSFPVVKDLAINRKSFDRILESGGYISVKTGGAPDGNATPIFKDNADEAFDSATCIGCGACVAACKNSSAMLFVGAKVNQYANLPQGLVEHKKRVNDLVTTMDNEGFGSCTNTGACEIECPKGISIEYIAKMNREYLSASISEKK